MSIPTCSAINGHSPAGGAILAISCDYLIMVASDKFTIGLTTPKYGLVAPFWILNTFVATIGQREAKSGLLNGKLFSVNEAKNIGLIDDVSQTPTEAIEGV